MEKESSFTVRRSRNISFSETPGGSSSGFDSVVDDPRRTKIASIDRVSKEKIEISFVSEDGSEGHGYLRARNTAGAKELDSIESNARSFVGRSYHELINGTFEVD